LHSIKCKNRFQNVPFKCNVRRYIGVPTPAVGLCTLNQVDT
jgi:hypothetical protein